MTRKQKIELRLSEVRTRLNEISGLEGDAFTDEIRTEADKLKTEFSDLETRHQAAIISEGDEQRKLEADNPNFTPDGESKEIRELIEKVSIADYLSPAAAGSGITGAAAELNAALEVPVVGKSGGVAIPWRVLLTDERREADQGETEKRAFTDSGDYVGGVSQRPILQRLFGMDILAALGVRIDSVPSGRSEWPLITAGVSPSQKEEGTAAADAVAVTFATETLKPKRLTGAYEFTHEIAAQVPDLEQALRRDLASAVKAQMSNLALNGDEDTNSHEPDGFLTKITAPTKPGAESAFKDYASSPAQAVDGIHSSMESEVSIVLGVASYRHAAGQYQSSGSGESASEALKRRSKMCLASSFTPVPPASGANQNIQSGNIYHAAGPVGTMRGDSIAAIWPTLELVRDIYSKSSQGVVLTWITLWDLEAAFRSAAYQRVSFKLA